MFPDCALGSEMRNFLRSLAVDPRPGKPGNSSNGDRVVDFHGGNFDFVDCVRLIANYGPPLPVKLALPEQPGVVPRHDQPQPLVFCSLIHRRPPTPASIASLLPRAASHDSTRRPQAREFASKCQCVARVRFTEQGDAERTQLQKTATGIASLPCGVNHPIAGESAGSASMNAGVERQEQ